MTRPAVLDVDCWPNESWEMVRAAVSLGELGEGQLPDIILNQVLAVVLPGGLGVRLLASIVAELSLAAVLLETSRRGLRNDPCVPWCLSSSLSSQTSSPGRSWPGASWSWPLRSGVAVGPWG